MRHKNIFEPNSKEWHVWNLHHEGKSIPQIAELLRMSYEQVKDTVLYGFRCLG